MRYFIIAVVASILTVIPNASATILTLGMEVAFSGPTPPGVAPWVTATFNDEGTTGRVVLTITATNLSSTEKLTDLVFNLNPALNPKKLVFSPATIMRGDFTKPTISKGTNAFDVDSGYYDIRFAFTTSKGGFTSGDAVQYTITGIKSLTANSFDFKSSSRKTQDMYLTAAEIQNHAFALTNTWTTTPEPSTVVMFGIGSLFLCRKRKNGY